MTNGATNNLPQIIESNRSREEVALDRAVSEVFYEFGLIEPAKPQMGMVNIKSAEPATFTQRMLAVMEKHAPEVHKIVEKFFEYTKLKEQKIALTKQLEQTRENIQSCTQDKAKLQELKDQERDIAGKIGMTTEKIEALQAELLATKINRNGVLERIEIIETLLKNNQKEEILPLYKNEGGSYGQEFVKILQTVTE